MNKHERVYKVLCDAFAGDEDKFYEYFTVRNEELAARKRKRKAGTDPDLNLRAYQLVAEAIPRCKFDINKEKQHSRYRDITGGFSDELWRTQWKNQNDWEVWRALGLERYTAQKNAR